MKNLKKTSKIKQAIVNYVINNKREYIIILIMFIIGLFAGVLFINNIKQEQLANISNYINDFIENYKKVENFDIFNLIKISALNNIAVAGSLCFLGTTVIGIPLVFGIIIYKGFCLGYTISSCITVLGTSKGLAFILSDLLLQNIIIIPVIISIAVSGLKLYQSIIKDRRKENIKISVLRHLIFCGIMALALVVSTLIEVFISNNILKIVVNYL